MCGSSVFVYSCVHASVSLNCMCVCTEISYTLPLVCSWVYCKKKMDTECECVLCVSRFPCRVSALCVCVCVCVCACAPLSIILLSRPRQPLLAVACLTQSYDNDQHSAYLSLCLCHLCSLYHNTYTSLLSVSASVWCHVTPLNLSFLK